MIEYIQEVKIPFEEIGTEFPNKGPMDFYHLNGVEEGFVDKDFSTNTYLFYATVMNDFTDAELNELDRDWLIVKRFDQWPISVILYKKPR